MGKALYCFWPSVVFSSLGGFLGFPLPFFSASAFRLRMSFPLPPERLGDGSERHQTWVLKNSLPEIHKNWIASGWPTNDFLCSVRHFLSPKFPLISEISSFSTPTDFDIWWPG
jgi:hypothetical protein